MIIIIVYLKRPKDSLMDLRSLKVVLNCPFFCFINSFVALQFYPLFHFFGTRK